MTVPRAILVPFHYEETIDLMIAAHTAGVSESTMRTMCRRDGMGRKVGGVWRVSRPALAMFLDGDHVALAAYHAGVRRAPPVLEYFERAGLSVMLRSPVFNNRPADSTNSTNTAAIAVVR